MSEVKENITVANLAITKSNKTKLLKELKKHEQRIYNKIHRDKNKENGTGNKKYTSSNRANYNRGLVYKYWQQHRLVPLDTDTFNEIDAQYAYTDDDYINLMKAKKENKKNNTDVQLSLNDVKQIRNVIHNLDVIPEKQSIPKPFFTDENKCEVEVIFED